MDSTFENLWPYFEMESYLNIEAFLKEKLNNSLVVIHRLIS